MWRKVFVFVALIGVFGLVACNSDVEDVPELETAVVAERAIVFGDISDEPAETIVGLKIAGYSKRCRFKTRSCVRPRT